MTSEQENLVKELLKIRNTINRSESKEDISELIDKAISLSIPVQPHMFNAEIIGSARLYEGKQRIIEMLRGDKDFFKTDWELNDIKLMIVTSLAMLMLRFVRGFELDELIKSY